MIAKHFEFLVLEGAQTGLNWLVILNKREGYRRAFSDFESGEGSEIFGQAASPNCSKTRTSFETE